MMEIIVKRTPRLHVRFEGRSWDLPLADLDLSPLSADDEVRTALAGYLQTPVARLALYVIERHPSGNLTVRPEAVFG